MTIFAQRRIEAARMALDVARYWLRDAARYEHEADWRAHCIMQARRNTERAELFIAAAEQMQDMEKAA